MCFDHGQPTTDHPRSPAARSPDGGSRSTHPTATGSRRSTLERASPGGAAIVILPDVRGLHPYYEELRPALRGARHRCTGDRLVRPDSGRRAAPEGFEYMPHVQRTTWSGISTDITAAVGSLRSAEGGETRARDVFTIGFCMGGRMAFLSSTLGLGLAGVIGLYGTVAGPWRNDAPAPVDLGRGWKIRCWACSVARTPASPREAGRGRSTARWVPPASSAGIVTYPGAPHSFFDRKFEELRGRERSGLGRDPRLHRGARHAGLAFKVSCACALARDDRAAGTHADPTRRQRLARVQAPNARRMKTTTPRSPPGNWSAELTMPLQRRPDRPECPREQTRDAVADRADESVHGQSVERAGRATAALLAMDGLIGAVGDGITSLLAGTFGAIGAALQRRRGLSQPAPAGGLLWVVVFILLAFGAWTLAKR